MQHATAADPAATLPWASGELDLYRRQIMLAELGLEGQARLRAARALVVGAGGLGSVALRYLAAAGVGTIGFVEFDTVDASNLHRQILFEARDVGRSKAKVTSERLSAANPWVEVEAHEIRLDAGNADRILAGYDVVIDASDNFAARYLIGDACLAVQVPNVSASILRFEGQISVFAPRGLPCYRCLFPEPPPADLAPSCAEAGVIGVLPGLLGCMQAGEAIKILAGIGEPLFGRLLTLDMLSMRFRELRTAPRHDCEACGARAGELALGTVQRTGRPGSNAAAVIEVDAERLAGEVGRGEVLLVDVRTPAEHAAARIANSRLIPVGDVLQRAGDLPRDVPLVCYCHKGTRSRAAAAVLADLGFASVRSLRGGIDAWSQQIDASVPRY